MITIVVVIVEDFPKTQVNDQWACFKDEMETYLKTELGEEVFMKIREETARELGYDKPSIVLKNLEGAERFIQKVYDRGKTLPSLEDIINKITLLRRN